MNFKYLFYLVKSYSTQLGTFGNVPSEDVLECADKLEETVVNYFRNDIISLLNKHNLYPPNDYGFDNWHDLLCAKFPCVAEYIDTILSEKECQFIYENNHLGNDIPMLDNSMLFNCLFEQRIIRSLNNHGINTVRPLMSMSQDEIKMIIGIGEKSALKIIDTLEKHKDYFIIKSLEEV